MTESLKAKYEKRIYEKPIQFKYMLANFVADILTENPENIVDYATSYFETLRDERNLQLLAEAEELDKTSTNTYDIFEEGIETSGDVTTDYGE